MAAYELVASLARYGRESGSVYHFFDGLDVAFDFLRSEFQFVILSARKRLLTEPKNAGLKACQLERGRRFVRGNRTARNENLLGQGNADGFASGSSISGWSAPAFDGFDSAAFVRGSENELIADFN